MKNELKKRYYVIVRQKDHYKVYFENEIYGSLIWTSFKERALHMESMEDVEYIINAIKLLNNKLGYNTYYEEWL